VVGGKASSLRLIALLSAHARQARDEPAPREQVDHEDRERGQARIDGYRAALERAGIEFDRRLVRYGDFRHEGGFAASRELLALEDRPTAIFAGSDQQAMGAYEAARQADLQVPRDVSVVGFDDLPLCQWLSPPLTTVRQPLEEMGRLAARALFQQLDGEPLVSPRIELATELRVRLSTAPPPAQT
jgi:LacI family transcriptional regulator